MRNPKKLGLRAMRSNTAPNSCYGQPRRSSADAAAWPFAARAQQGERVRRIGVLTAPDEDDPFEKTAVSAFTQTLADLGWTDGHNVRIDLRWGGGDINRIRALAQELVSLPPDIIVTVATPATVAVQRQTRTIPIVFANVGDPVAAASSRGSTARVGTSPASPTLKPRWGASGLSCSRRSRPGSSGSHSCSIPTWPPVSAFMPSLETAARSLKVEPIIAPVHSDVALGRERGGGLVVVPDGFIGAHQPPIISAAARNNVPAVYWPSDFARDGGLLSYVPDYVDIFRRAATYVDRILRGAKPGDLPVQFPTKFEMAVNLKTAKALGLTVPPSILLRADEVIE
jgi:putative ABC transport system substrate-binding protein